MQPTQGGQTTEPFLLAQARPGQHEAVLQPARLLIDGKALARVAADRHRKVRQANGVQRSTQHLSEWAAGRVNGERVAAQRAHHPRDVDPATAGIVSGRGTAQLLGRDDPRRTHRQVHGRI